LEKRLIYAIFIRQIFQRYYTRSKSKTDD